MQRQGAQRHFQECEFVIDLERLALAVLKSPNFISRADIDMTLPDCSFVLTSNELSSSVRNALQSQHSSAGLTEVPHAALTHAVLLCLQMSTLWMSC